MTRAANPMKESETHSSVRCVTISEAARVTIDVISTTETRESFKPDYEKTDAYLMKETQKTLRKLEALD